MCFFIIRWSNSCSELLFLNCWHLVSRVFALIIREQKSQAIVKYGDLLIYNCQIISQRKTWDVRIVISYNLLIFSKIESFSLLLVNPLDLTDVHMKKTYSIFLRDVVYSAWWEVMLKFCKRGMKIRRCFDKM